MQFVVRLAPDRLLEPYSEHEARKRCLFGVSVLLHLESDRLGVGWLWARFLTERLWHALWSDSINLVKLCWNLVVPTAHRNSTLVNVENFLHNRPTTTAGVGELNNPTKQRIRVQILNSRENTV